METIAPPPMANAQLAEAFSSFIAAAGRLEHSHWQLHDEVTHLRTQLEERNRALASSLAENERMRIALRHILDALPCGVAVLEPNSKQIVLLNPEAQRLLEISTDRTPAWTSLPERIRTVLDAEGCPAWKQGDEHDFCFDGHDKKRWVTVRYSAMADAETGKDKRKPEQGPSSFVVIPRSLKKLSRSGRLPATWLPLLKWQPSWPTRSAIPWAVWNC
jgi:PAS domain-containing protein